MAKEKEGFFIGKGDDFFGAVLNCAIRYCIGRRSYMPRLVTDWIMEHCSGMLTGKTLFVAMRDIDEVRQEMQSGGFRSLGDECDVQTWNKFYEWLRKEEENRHETD